TSTILMFALLLNLGTFAHAQAESDNLVGMYQCSGTTAGGEKYQGIVEIAKVDDIYLVRWVVQPDVYIGIGVVQGNVFSVSFAAGTLGLGVYTVEADARLVGRWTTMAAGGQLFIETLTKVDPTTVTPPAAAPPKPRPRVTLPA